MSLVKWCPTQQALPKSAIFTEMVSIAVLMSSWLLFLGDPDLFSEMPDIFSVKTSLHLSVPDLLTGCCNHLRGFFSLLLSIVSAAAIAWIRSTRILDA